MTLALTFGAPLLLIGLLAAAIPFVLHLLSSVRAQEQPFPTLRFLRVSMQKTARRRRIRHWLLLVLRSVLLGLLAMGVAEPITRATGGWMGSKDYAAVIILDNSLSMAAASGPMSRFAGAKIEAASLLAGDDKPAAAALMTTNGGFVSQEVTTRLDKLREALEKTTVGNGVAPIAERIAEAVRMLEDQSRPQKSIYVLSDLQKVSFERFGALEQLKETDIHLFLIDTAPAAADNVGITDLRITGRRVADSALTFTATLANSSSKQRKVDIELCIEGDEGSESGRRISRILSPRGIATVQFRHAFRKPGLFAGDVRIHGDDDLAADNVRRFVVDVAGRVKVVIVRGPFNPAGPSSDDPARMVEVALDPYTDPKARWPITLAERGVISAEAFDAGDLDAADALFLCDVPDFTEPQAGAIVDFAAGGGTVVFLLGPNARAENYNERFVRDEKARSIAVDGGLLPGSLGEPVGRVGRRAPTIAVDSVDARHPYLDALFDNFADYLSVRVQRYYRLTETPRSERVLMRLSSGDPLLITRRFGRGRVLLCTSGSSHRWSNLLGTGANVLVPIVIRAALLARREPWPDSAHLAGSQVIIRPGKLRTKAESPKKLPIRVTFPSDGNEPRTRTIDARDVGEGYVATFTDTSRVGVYRWEAADPTADGQIISGAFAVNPDGKESFLESFSPADVERSWRNRGLRRLCVGPSLAAVNVAAAVEARGRNWWDLLVSAVVLLLVAEAVLANRSRQRGQETLPANLNANVSP